MLGLQDILSNKQTRGAFGEIQLREIVTRALPPDVVTFQATLSTGVRADCLIDLPQPPGPIVIDAKFPLEAYEALRAAKTPAGGAGGAAADARRGPRAHAGDRREIRDRGRDRRGRADVPALGGGLCRAARELRRPGARGLRAAGLDRVADHLHGDAAHAARGAEGRAAARRGARDPPRARPAATATSSGCRRGSAASTATSARPRRTSRRSASPPTRRRAAPAGSRRSTSTDREPSPSPRPAPRRCSRRSARPSSPAVGASLWSPSPARGRLAAGLSRRSRNGAARARRLSRPLRAGERAARAAVPGADGALPGAAPRDQATRATPPTATGPATGRT